MSSPVHLHDFLALVPDILLAKVRNAPRFTPYCLHEFPSDWLWCRPSLLHICQFAGPGDFWTLSLRCRV